jgi:antirestriction protein ArdC
MPSVYEVITDRIIQQLEAGVAPWQRPWRLRGRGGLPRNLVTGREYRGVNVWILLSSGFASPCWLTFRQATELGGHVRKGEAGLPVVYWKFGTRARPVNQANLPINAADCESAAVIQNHCLLHLRRCCDSPVTVVRG